MKSLRRRRFLYGLRYWLSRALDWPIVLISRWLLNSEVVEVVRGIRLTQLHLNHTNEALFLRATYDALAWLERDDPRRLRRIQRHIRFISNEVCLTPGEYERRLRRCGVDIDDFTLEPDSEEYPWFLARYVAMLVHEATHGHLHSLGIPHVRATRVRIERICRSEEKRVVARLRCDGYNFIQHSPVPDFDERAAQAFIETGWVKRARTLLSRMREAKQRENGVG